MPSSFGTVEVSDGSCGPPGTHEAKRIVPLFADLPQAGLVMVSRDHTSCGWAADLFKESMRRDAMTGTKMEFALRNASRGEHPYSKKTSTITSTGTHIEGMSWTFS